MNESAISLPIAGMSCAACAIRLEKVLNRLEGVSASVSFASEQALNLLGQPEITVIDLRERRERERHGSIPGALHLPYPGLDEHIGPGGVLHELAKAANKTLIFYCAFGERSAMAVEAAQQAGITTARHISGGLDAWKKAGGAVVR